MVELLQSQLGRNFNVYMLASGLRIKRIAEIIGSEVAISELQQEELSKVLVFIY